MALILSFAWTTPALVTLAKDTTRRDWKERTIRQYERAAETGELVHAWSKSPRFKGVHVANITILEVIREERSGDIPNEDWFREGFHALTAIGAEFQKGWGASDVWNFWREAEPESRHTVIRFEVGWVTQAGKEIMKQYDELAPSWREYLRLAKERRAV